MDDAEKACEPVMLSIVNFIASQHISWIAWNREQSEARKSRPSYQKMFATSEAKRAWKQRAEECYVELIKAYSKGSYFNQLDEKFYPFNRALSLNSFDHPVREIQERYLLVKLDIEHSGTPSENWAAIGLALANEETGLVKILCPPKKEKRGRRSGYSLDYERAVWKLMLDEHSWDAAKHVAGDDYIATFYSLSEILDGYFYAFEHPNEHEHMHVFEHLESVMKLKGKSRDSLLVAFNRGEKQRSALWDD